MNKGRTLITGLIIRVGRSGKSSIIERRTLPRGIAFILREHAGRVKYD